jgi:hypothetical protein
MRDNHSEISAIIPIYGNACLDRGAIWYPQHLELLVTPLVADARYR